MATPTAKRKQSQPSPKTVVEVVDPRWLMKALAITLAVAACFAYLAVCLLIYQGGWQLLLHPVAKVDANPSVAFQAIRFDAAATGNPRLAGWWIPAASDGFAAPQRTILYLHDGSGSLAAAARKLDLLHRAKVNIFAIDYRGFGQSEGPHPTEARMNEDAEAAFTYLTDTRHVAPGEVVPYGEGLGAVFAAKLASSHGTIRGVIMDGPDPGAFARATGDAKSRLLPMHALVQEHFDAAAALKGLRTPKLLLTGGPFAEDAARVRASQEFFRTVSDPKIKVTLDTAEPSRAADAYVDSVLRFLDEYVPG